VPQSRRTLERPPPISARLDDSWSHLAGGTVVAAQYYPSARRALRSFHAHSGESNLRPDLHDTFMQRVV
jgi:hypothetical protein